MSSITVAPGEVLVFTWAGEATQEGVLAALGAELEDPAHLEVFDAAKIAPVGMAAFLAEGHGIATEDLSPDAERLDALTGTVAVLSARAFGGASAEFAPAAGLELIARYREAAAPATAPRPFGTESAKGTLSGGPAKAPKSDARIGGMVALAVLVFLALFVLFFVWSAG